MEYDHVDDSPYPETKPDSQVKESSLTRHGGSEVPSQDTPVQDWRLLRFACAYLAVSLLQDGPGKERVKRPQP